MTERAPVRIAMWSGPRTLSTAPLRAWENRPDTVVVDEPLYAYYLAATGIDHPGRDEILAGQPTDWRTVVRSLTTGGLPDGATISWTVSVANKKAAWYDFNTAMDLPVATAVGRRNDTVTGADRDRLVVASGLVSHTTLDR